MDGRKAKRDLDALLKYLRRRGLLYLWVLEFQLRGAPHFHMALSGGIPKAELALAWYRIVNSGDRRHLRAGTRIEGIRSLRAVGMYFSGYASKLAQKDVPEGYQDVGRFWGCSRELCASGDLLEGDRSDIVPLVRFARRAFLAGRRTWPNVKGRWRDKGGVGFVAWGAGPALLALVNQAVKGVLDAERCQGQSNCCLS
jgi:hypothetical protein